ncbi:TetR/AcrR family transcriptional regulator [Rhodococcus opacus]|nr:TetR/AcrR family transcriptional regulator [Rhodococcus opacus]NHU49459.1 TetR/AcrR family transcriptional regulator [Rhodococcus sp. A14]MDV6245046.1 TetR/AcrR family transcriptional regulator [Rhodococcus opacus]MDX5968343.1 TetR/AcrR family transcriptional regulator [Rhodococcus opacus]NKY76153.1 TetR/AcrR family transcriptional regulator [Rhodococcus opacus]QZS53203.1 TetR/AcrR family transcriptional regulator [Rhodococcus opacus]
MEMRRKAPRGTRKRDVPLTKDGIYAMALQLIDADDVEALTMRKLATALDANPMSLYHHVPNKEALLHSVAARVGSQFRTGEQTDIPWQERLRQLALDFRALAHRHPKLMAYSFARADYVQPEDPFWRGLTDVLAAAKLPASEIPRVAASLCAVFTGLLLSELTGALQRWTTLPPARPGPDGEDAPPPRKDVVDAMFSYALDATIAGVESHIARTREEP